MGNDRKTFVQETGSSQTKGEDEEGGQKLTRSSCPGYSCLKTKKYVDDSSNESDSFDAVSAQGKFTEGILFVESAGENVAYC
jgi:hypothetical protein